MRAVIVPLTLLALLFLAYVIWQIRAAAEKARAENRQREKEREEWSDRMMKGDPDDAA